MSDNPTLVVDPTACVGHAICAHHLPERIRLDDWDFPIVDPTPLVGALLGHARRAVGDCPALALSLRSADGSRR